MPELRDAVADLEPGVTVLVGGGSATQYDFDQAIESDLKLIAPVALLVIAIILAILLRAIVAPLVLIASVILSFLCTLGLSILFIRFVVGDAGFDASIPTFAFIFLVALGIDYTIFLMARVREEARTHGTREGMLRAISATGPVITSAGVILAGTFSVLMTLPVTYTFDLGFMVALGILLDTFIVRTIMVPAAVELLGDKIWWPSTAQGGAVLHEHAEDRPEPSPTPRSRVPGAVDESGAIAGLERTEERLRAYATERGLTVRPELIWPGMPLPSEQRGPIRHACWSVSGKLPGGVAGRLRHQAVYGKTFGMKVAMQHTIMVCRIPESVGYLPMLSVRAEGLEPALFYWAGDKRPREDVGGFESVELDRRYIVEVAKGQDHAWLRQLFPPSFIDWLASNTPGRLRLPPRRRRLHLRVPAVPRPAPRRRRGRRRAPRPARRRGRQGGEPDPRRGAGGGRRLLGRDQPRQRRRPPGAGDGPQARPPARHGDEGRRRRSRPTTASRSSATGTGWSVKDPAEFHANHIRLPLPGTASDVLTGTLPGTGTPGDLAWLEFSSAVDLQRNYNAVVIETDRELPSLWVDADDVTIPGFGERARAGGAGGGAHARLRDLDRGAQGVRLPGLAAGVVELAEAASGSRSLCAAGGRDRRRDLSVAVTDIRPRPFSPLRPRVDAGAWNYHYY